MQAKRIKIEFVNETTGNITMLLKDRRFDRSYMVSVYAPPPSFRSIAGTRHISEAYPKLATAYAKFLSQIL